MKPRISYAAVVIGLAGCANRPIASACPEPSSKAAIAPSTSASATASAAAIPYDFPNARDFPLPPSDPVELPSSKTSEPAAVVFAVQIDKTGALSVNGKRVGSDDELLKLAREQHARDPETRAMIQADRAAAWGSVVRAIDVLKQASLNKIAFVVSAQP